MTMVSSREFNRDVSAVKRAAAGEPVIINDHGRPPHVLLSFADYRRLTGSVGSLGDAFVLDEEIEFEPVQPRDSMRESATERLDTAADYLVAGAWRALSPLLNDQEDQ